MRLIDADALKEELCKEYRHFDQRIAISPVFEAIKKAPTVDAVEVMRCKNCTWRLGTDCTRFAEVPVSLDDYCSRAERKRNRT